ncbi:putative disease resistance protein At1g59780 isoform X2 [Salvia splendens]|uniref:putative disease resistance protein At1g59780 isoform X2 n=1 Tax=Salvia splendens TaxID=180675 RepID=UPI001C262607|nr:putative disease resistance protein At1g59780 isoform X2 [Salvia splendens]
MVESVANVFLQSLNDLLVEEIEHLVGASDEAEQAKKDLGIIHSLLMKADSNRHDSPTLKDHITQLKDLSSKAENVLETSYALKAAFNQEANHMEKFQRYVCVLRELYSVDKVRRDTRDIISGLSGLTNSLVMELGRETTETSTLSTATSLDHPFVGMEKDMELLLSMVKDESTGKRVVKISGMSGLGKTSLVRKIYNHADLHSYARAWVCIHRDFQPKAVLAEILKQLDPNTYVRDGMGVDDLVRRIYKFVERRKSLVVIDDIWKNDGWEIMREAFPINCNVFLVTRSESVGGEECDHLYKLGVMTEDEGWELLKGIALPKDFGSETLEGIGREIVVKCGLLPLAISVIGGILLHKKGDILSEWKKVNMNLSDVEDVDEYKRVKHVLELSYDALPYYLKPCFLYLACFPQNEEIKTERLYRLWMAEGFISHHDKGPNETLIDVAERYLTELATRQMVQVQKGDSPLHKFDSCRLHDLMLELCSSKVEEEKLFKLIDTPSIIFNFISRVRSFMPLGRGGLSFQRIGSEDRTIGSEQTLHSSRILKFKGDKLPSKVGKLILLRYLSLMDSSVRELPKFVCNMPYLQTLELRAWGSVLRLPNVLWKMKRLKHLFLPRDIQVIRVEKPRLGWLEVTEREKLRLDGLDELETLQHIDSKTVRVKDILKLNSLKEVCATVHDMDSLSAIIQQKSISSLRLVVNHCDLSSDVVKNALMCPSLVSLEMYTCKVVGAGFPCYEEGMAENVVDMNIRYCKVEGDLMLELGKFPRLLSLWLQGREVGRMMEVSVCGANSFPELKRLELHRWPNLKKWEVEEGGMPKLSKLYIRTCWNLEKIPDGLRFISGLRQLNIFKMSQVFTNRIREGGQDYGIVSHIPSFYIYGDSR